MYEITFKIDEDLANQLAKVKTLQGPFEILKTAAQMASGDVEGSYETATEAHDWCEEFGPALVSLHLLARSAILKAKHSTKS